MISLDEARDYLRIDEGDNDAILLAILKAIPPFIETATGIDEQIQDNEPMAMQVSKLMLMMWYDVDRADVDKLQRTIDALLIAIKAKYNEKLS